MKLHTLALIAALATSGASLSIAQTAQPGTQPAPSTGTAPTTPPTHPAERGGTDMKKNSKAEAMQACKNLSSTEEQQACMKQHKSGMSKSKTGTAAEKAQNGSGTGYSSPDTKP